MVDFATIFGLILGFGLIIAAIMFGGNVAGFLNWPSVFIVIGGTFAITTVSFSISDIIKAQFIVLKMLFFKLPEQQSEAGTLLRLSQKARTGGTLTLEKDVRTLKEPFAQQGLMFAIDNTPPEQILTALEGEITSMAERHEKTIAILRRAAEVAPAMGLIGTLIGLVQMLGNLTNPSSIGPAMAVALLTTLYGAILSHMVFAPLATKLEKNSDQEVALRKLYTIGIISIARKENPRQLQIMLNAALPPEMRMRTFKEA